MNRGAGVSKGCPALGQGGAQEREPFGALAVLQDYERL